MSLVIIPDYLRNDMLARINAEIERIGVPQEKQEAVREMAYECLLAHFDAYGEIADFTLAETATLTKTT